MLTADTAAPLPVPSVGVLVVCPNELVDQYRAPLHAICRVATTASPEVAVQYVDRAKPTLVIVDGDRTNAAWTCETMTSARTERPSILVTVTRPEVAGQVIDKCDSILLKPFAPNLLVGRVGRLIRLRQRSEHARQNSQRLLERVADTRRKSAHLRERRAAGTLIEWPNARCPHCDRASAVMFDYAAKRRAWFACLECRKVWLAQRVE
jgi:hypothetical protein